MPKDRLNHRDLLADAARYLEIHATGSSIDSLSEAQRSIYLNLMVGFACEVLIKQVSTEERAPQ